MSNLKMRSATELAGKTIAVSSSVTALEKCASAFEFVFVAIKSPVLLAKQSGTDLAALIREDSVSAADVIEHWAAAAKVEAISAAQSAATGIVYRLGGADEASLTPMEYGGLLLEHDIAILAQLPDSLHKLALIESETAPYLDLLGSLACDAFLIRTSGAEQECTIGWLDDECNAIGSEKFSLVIHEH